MRKLASPPHPAPGDFQAHAKRIEDVLRLEPRSRVLDLGCGDGRQTLELARRSHRVLGLDGSQAALEESRAAAKAERLNAHFLRTDIRKIPYRAEFDAAVALYASFGRFAAERDDLQVLEATRKALKAGGKLLMDLANKEWLMRHASGAAQAVDLETGRLDGHRLYTLTEMKSLIARAGLLYRRSWGGFDGSNYEADSPRLIVLAEKTVEKHPHKKEDNLARAIKIKGRR